METLTNSIDQTYKENISNLIIDFLDLRAVEKCNYDFRSKSHSCRSTLLLTAG